MKRRSWLAVVLVAMAAMWGCSDDDSPVTPTQTAYEMMVEAGAAYINDSIDCPGVISAADLVANGLENYTIFDIRSEQAYLDGHIPGAIHAGLGTILSDVAAKALPMDANIVVACYSGQSAGHAKVALELMGYENVKSLLFGMSSWCTATSGSWNGGIGNALGAGAETTNNNASLTTHTVPTLSDDVATVVADRVAAMLAGGFKGIAYTDMLANGLENYFIVNYFGEADYLGAGTSGVPGHIPGAFQFTPYASMGVDQMLGNLPTDMPIVVYCWTGQHSSQITAYLNMLGYEAYSLKFGSNALFHDNLTAHKWSAAAINEFDMDYGLPANADFAAMATAGAAYVNDSADCPGVISAATLHANGVENYKIFDIRSEQTYINGHIPGAIHSSLGSILVDVAANASMSDNIVVACYTGQSAGHAKIALELSGYENVQSLLFGMSSWNSVLRGSWDGGVGNALPLAETMNNNADLGGYVFPELVGSVDEQVASMLAGGFKGISYTDMSLNGLENYFIINYFGEADYVGVGTSGVPGHIPGAFQFTPYESMGIEQMLPHVPTDMPVVVYCWTGQHSSQVTAYLNMLGYEAYSLKFGSNALFHTDLTAHKWGDAAVNEFDMEYGLAPNADFSAMAAAGSDYVNDSADCPGVISAATLNTNGATNYKIFDLRSSTVFAAGHIQGAINTTLSTLLVDVAANATTSDNIVVACYTGQSAGHAKIALELSGYENVQSLLFGMASWNSTLRGSWDGGIGNALAVAETDNNNGDLAYYTFPELSGTVADRVAAMLTGGFKGINYADMVTNGLENYFVINYFGEADYEGAGTSGVPGHIPGAFQYTPYASMGVEEMLVHIPTDMPVVIYCWTGQHSSQITAYLNMLGYDAYSLKFGSNALFHDALTAHKWSSAATNDFPLVTD